MKEMNQANELITGFRRGTLHAVRELYAIHYSSLLLFSEKIIRDHPVAREIVVETFIKLLNRRSFLENATDVKAFLYITARNSCMDFLRFAKNRQSDQVSLDVPVSESDHSNESDVSEANRLLSATIQHLPAFSQQVFRILFAEGMQLTAAARQLDIDPRELLNCRKDIMRHLQTVLTENKLFSTPFFIHFLTVACRKNAPETLVPVPVNR